MSLFEEQAHLFKALGDPTRLRILAMLQVREVCVCELAARLPVSQPAVSQHLRRLRDAGLIAEHHARRWTYYAIRSDLPEPTQALIDQLPTDREDAAWLRQTDAQQICTLLVISPAAGEPSSEAPLGAGGHR